MINFKQKVDQESLQKVDQESLQIVRFILLSHCIQFFCPF